MKFDVLQYIKSARGRRDTPEGPDQAPARATLTARAARPPLSGAERSLRYALLVISALIGLSLLLGGSGHGKGHAHGTASGQGQQGQQGTQAGGVGASSIANAPTARALPALCNPLDITCDLSSAANSLANAILRPLIPIIDAIDQNPLNFISQTPVCLSACPTVDSPYAANATVVTLMGWASLTVSLAVAVMLALAGLRIIMARQVGELSLGVMEYLPRLALAVIAAQLSGYLLQFFIDLENALCLSLIQHFDQRVLFNTIDGIFHLDLVGAGLITFALAMVLGVMNLLIAWQMLVRLGLLFLLIVLAPFGLFCLGSDFTLGWGRLWMTTFSITLFIQFIQVVALALGGLLISFVSASGLGNLDATLLSILSSIAVLSLVLKIPGMIQNWALRPIAAAGSAYTNAYSNALGMAMRVVTTM